MRRAQRRDDNEALIVATLESIPGVVVVRDTSGRCDLHVRRAHWVSGIWIHFEIKTPEGRVKKHQGAMLLTGETILVRSTDEILQRIGVNS